VFDVGLLAAAWAAVRAPLAWFALPPMIQFDTFGYLSGDLNKPPLYGWFLRLFSPVPAVLAQQLLVLASALILYAAARSAANRSAGLVVGLLVSTYGGFAMWGNVLMSETLFNFFLAAHLGVLWLAIRRKSGWGFFLAGATAGLAANVRPTFQVQPLAIAAALLPFHLSRDEVKRLAALVAALLAGFLAICVPGAIRAYLLAGRGVPLSAILPKVLILRMTADKTTPLAAVPAADPVVASIRDYLSEESADDDVGSFRAYEHICGRILPRGAASEALADSYVMTLWISYLRRYPVEYLRFAGKALWSNLSAQEWLIDVQQFSRYVLTLVVPGRRLRPSRMNAEILSQPEPSAKTLIWLNAFFLQLCLVWAAPWAILCVAALETIVFAYAKHASQKRLAPAPPPAAETAALLFPDKAVRAYWWAVYATAAFAYLPIFLVNVSVYRFRLPLDLIYFLALGRAVARGRAALLDRRRRSMADSPPLAPGEESSTRRALPG
jgi:hypothetical protein